MQLIFHAYRCQKKDDELPEKDRCVCKIPRCLDFKTLLNHTKTCDLGSLCTVPNCNSTRKLIHHWAECARLDCTLCGPNAISLQRNCKLRSGIICWWFDERFKFT